MERAKTEPWGFGGHTEEEKQKLDWCEKRSENTLQKLLRNLGKCGCFRGPSEKKIAFQEARKG